MTAAARAEAGPAGTGRILVWLDRARRGVVLAVAWLLLIAFTGFDYYTGPDVSFLVFYLLPLYITAYHVGRGATIAIAVGCAVGWLLPRGILHPGASQGQLAWNLAVKTALFQVVGLLLHGVRRAHDRAIDETIRVEHARMVHLLGLLPEGVALVPRDGSTLVQNEAALRLARLQGSASVDELARALGVATRPSLAPGAVEELETVALGRIIVHLMARPAADEPVVWVMRDVTEERTTLAHAIHESKMSELGLLAAGVAHEVGNPLSSLSAIVQLLQTRALPPDVAERLAALHGHVLRMDRIVKTVTRFARKSNTRGNRAAVGAVLDRALDMFRFHEKSREIELDVATLDRDLVLPMSEDELVQALLNLLLNAVDAQGGRGRISIQSREAAGEVRIAVSDQGTGMDLPTLSKLFTPFFTTKEAGRGTGLGLAVSQTLVVASGGRIEVESEVGRGSTFSICLPTAPKGPSKNNLDFSLAPCTAGGVRPRIT